MRLYELLSAVEVFTYTHPRDMDIRGITSDSRRVGQGDLFVCIRGLHEDGHTYLQDAVKAGAIAVMTEEGAENVPDEVAHIVVPNTRSALAKLYHAWYGRPGDRLRLIAVTGTNGKTSVSFMLRAIWEASMEKCGLIGTVACDSGRRHLRGRVTESPANMTTPDPEDLYRLLAEMEADGVGTVIMEATSHALALGKLDALHFDAAIFTNLTPEHLDFHGDMESYFEAKAKLFTMCDLAILNGDDVWAEKLRGRLRCPVRVCSMRREDADYAAEQIRDRGVEGISYRLRASGASMRIDCPIPGIFTVMNTLQAATLALERGKSPGCIHDTLALMDGVQGRMERVRMPLGAECSVFIDYAHTPDAMENLLRTARVFCRDGQRLVILFGCGGERDRSKRPVMGTLAVLLADFAVITSDNSRGEKPEDIIAEIVAGIAAQKKDNYTVIPDRREAIAYVLRHAQRGDVILLAGKGHETYEIDRTGRHPFDEREIVQRVAQELYPLRRPDEQNN